MGFLKGLVAMLATKYGTVTGGKYKGTSLALGSDTDKKIAVNATFNQLLFIKGTKELARVYTKEVSRYEIVTDTRVSATVKLVWTSGEESILVVPKYDNKGQPLFATTSSGVRISRLDHLISVLAEK